MNPEVVVGIIGLSGIAIGLLIGLAAGYVLRQWRELRGA